MIENSSFSFSSPQMRMALPPGVRISISFNPLGVASVLFCFRPVVPANEGTGTKDPLCGSSINSP
jgi:hypothetical protein